MYGKETTTDTSYFCLVIWSCSSNFSASSWYIHSHSSLALSLQEVEMQQCSSPCFFSALSNCCQHHLISLPDNLQLPESLLVQAVNVQWFASLAQDLLLLLSLRLPFSTALFCLQTSRRNQDPPSGYFNKNAPRCSVCSPASACTLQNGGWWGSSFSWHHLRLSSWLPPLPYEFSHPRFERIKTILLWLCGFCGYILGGSLHALTPQDASAALSPSRCGSFAALLAQPGDFPA